MVAPTMAQEADLGDVIFTPVAVERGTVCIYVLVNPIRGAIRYVGSAIDPTTRFAGHIAAARNRGWLVPVSKWIKALLDEGNIPEMYVVDCVHADDRADTEEAWTCFFEARGHDLLNRARPNYQKRAERALRIGQQQLEQQQRRQEIRAKYGPVVLAESAGVPNGFVKVEEAAEKRGCSAASIYYRIRSGALSSVEVEGALYVRAAEVKQLPPPSTGRPVGYRVTDAAVLARIPHGEVHVHAKLTETMVREMRRAHHDATATHSQLARTYNVSIVTVWSVVSRRTWKHVQDEAERPQQGKAG